MILAVVPQMLYVLFFEKTFYWLEAQRLGCGSCKVSSRAFCRISCAFWGLHSGPQAFYQIGIHPNHSTTTATTTKVIVIILCLLFLIFSYISSMDIFSPTSLTRDSFNCVPF